MRKIIQIAVFYFFIFCTTTSIFAQEKVGNDPDSGIKEMLYSKYKREVRAFDKNDFDTLFFEFFQKQNDPNLILTKEQFYTYTIKIAIYSEKLGLLYKDQRAEAQKTKQEWFNRSYEDYLISKK
jgi:hypothetical protein